MRTKMHARLTALLAATTCLASILFQLDSSYAQSPTPEQNAARPGIRVAPVILAEPEVETSVSIHVGPEASIPRQTFLRIRGVPLAAKLSEGHVVSPGVWAVPLTSLPQLRLHAPLASSGRTEIQLALVGVDGGVIAEARSSLVVAPAWLLGTSGGQRPASPPRIEEMRAPAQSQIPAQAQPLAAPPPPAAKSPAPVAPAPVIAAAPPSPPMPAVAPPPPPPPAPQPIASPPAPPAQPPVERAQSQLAALPPAATNPPPPPAPQVAKPPAAAPPAPAAVKSAPPPQAKAPPPISAADRERAENLVQRGEVFWRQGNFAAARQFFRRAADMGLAAGAMRMAATYDPIEIKSVAVVGLQPDPKEASIWYERAHELGAAEAGARLSRLQGR